MNQEERKLRSLVRKGIHIILERKNQQKNEEQRLRNIIHHLIQEVKGTTSVADKVIHRNSGINALDTLLRDVIRQIEESYKDLSSNETQRKSFRYHFLINFKNILAPVNANRFAPDQQVSLTEQDDDEPDVEISIDDELEDDDISTPGDPSKFIPLRPQDEEKAKEEKEEEEGFIKLDSDDPNVQQGAAFAEKTFNKVGPQIQTAYEELIAPDDAAAFYDWGLTNLKLYFDAFEGEMGDKLGEEPASPDYPPTGQAPLEEAYEI